MRLNQKILFKETQKFSQWWIWFPLGGIFAFYFYGCITQIFFGNNPHKDVGLIGLTVFLFMILLFFWQVRLETVVTKDGIYVKFFPFLFKLKFIPWDEISKAHVRKYRPLIEYGGWGLRYGFSGKAYNIRGNMGLQIDFKDSSNLLIGTQKAEELEAALRRLEIGKDLLK